MVKTWFYTNIHPESEIGDGTSIGSYVEIGKNVKIGKDCSIQAKVFIPELVTIEDNVFIGPGVIFTNDKYPPSYGKHWYPTLVKSGAVIGAGAVILPGLTIGKNAKVGAGSVVTKDIPDNVSVCGNPAKEIK